MEILRIIGIIGVLIYIFLLMQALYWLYQPLRGPAAGDGRNTNRVKVKYWNYKFVFQCIFSFYSILEIIYYTSIFVSNGYSLWAYGLHKFSLFLTVVLFAMVINLWGYALNYENTFLLSSFYAILIVFINFTVTIGDIIYMCTTPDYHSYTHNVNASSIPTIIHILSLLILVIILIFHCVRITSKLNQQYSPNLLALHPSSSSSTTATHIAPSQNSSNSSNQTSASAPMNDLAFVSMKLSLLTRLQIILHICFWCFTLRILLLSVKVYSRLESGVNTGFIYSLPIYLWFTLNNWVPNVIPSVLFIYMMRTTELKEQRSTSGERANSVASWVSWYYSESEGLGASPSAGELRPSSITFTPMQFKSVSRGSRGRKDSNFSDDVIEI